MYMVTDVKKPDTKSVEHGSKKRKRTGCPINASVVLQKPRTPCVVWQHGKLHIAEPQYSQRLTNVEQEYIE